MNNKSIWARPGVVVITIAVPIGILTGIIALLASTPNPPSWTRYALPLVPVVSVLVFIGAWFTMTFRRKR